MRMKKKMEKKNERKLSNIIIAGGTATSMLLGGLTTPAHAWFDTGIQRTSNTSSDVVAGTSVDRNSHIDVQIVIRTTSNNNEVRRSFNSIQSGQHVSTRINGDFTAGRTATSTHNNHSTRASATHRISR